jgi:DNA-binding IclR family transcriptional regulator
MRGSTSAPTSRVLDVVELLARPGNEALRFSDVVRELDLTQGTAHAILKTLCDRGWASRDPVDKTFSLGPALAVVGARTDMARPLAHAARAAALQLSNDCGLAASVVERFGDSLVITAFEGAGNRAAGAPGDRIRYAPPLGVAFAAWDTEEEQQAWMKRSGSSDAALIGRLERVLARTRERGFDVDWTTPALMQAAHVVGTLPSDGLPDHVRDITDQLLVEFTTIGLLSDEDPKRRAQPVATIAAPVFDRHRVALIVAVHPLRALTLKNINSIGRRVMKATAAVRVLSG